MRKTLRTVAIATCAVLATSTATAAASPSAPAKPGRALPSAHHAVYQGGIRPTHPVNRAGLAGVHNLATFSSSVNVDGTDYPYTLVGKDPSVPQATPSTTIRTEIIPVTFTFTASGDVYDATAPTSCDGTPALARVQKSPVFARSQWTMNGENIGKTQYVDADRRSEFWSYTNPAGINPGYHVVLQPRVAPTLAIDVPANVGAEGSDSCGNEGGIDINWWDALLEGTLLPNLTAAGIVNPSRFPLFVFRDVILFDGNPGNCCILGYHNANGAQTYGVASYEQGDFFGGVITDIEATTHEVAEWMDDPFVNNPTPAWGHTGQVSGCQNNLENGDPLTGTVIARTLGGYTYHVQELVYFSWFYRQDPSLGAGGLYSDNGTFTSPAVPCT